LEKLAGYEGENEAWDVFDTSACPMGQLQASDDGLVHSWKYFKPDHVNCDLTADTVESTRKEWRRALNNCIETKCVTPVNILGVIRCSALMPKAGSWFYRRNSAQISDLVYLKTDGSG
jgi:hypothetical protein